MRATSRQRRNSLRLQGYDYAQPGGYFVTICTYGRRCVLGRIVDGRMLLSEVGRVVEEVWARIPEHFENTRADMFQVMPNHLHGIVDIKEVGRTHMVTRAGKVNGATVWARHVVPIQEPTKEEFGKPRSGTLSTIIGSFKAAVTRELRRQGKCMERSFWHRSFHDHVLRDDVDRFFVERYIELNPILWDLDADNAALDPNSIAVLRRRLQELYGLTGLALERVVEHELNYRTWRERELQSETVCAD